jgi:hypothetical protein
MHWKKSSSKILNIKYLMSMNWYIAHWTLDIIVILKKKNYKSKLFISRIVKIQVWMDLNFLGWT